MITAALAEQHKAVFFDLPGTKNALLEVLRSFSEPFFIQTKGKSPEILCGFPVIFRKVCAEKGRSKPINSLCRTP